MPAREIDFASADGISWSTAIAFAIFHVLAVVALFFATWDAVLVALVLHWMCIGWGIGLGYHRLHTHRSYKTPKIVGVLLRRLRDDDPAGRADLLDRALHRIHHQKSDREGDPHTPRDGKWWSHMLWTIFGEALHGDIETMGKYSPDLLKDPFYRALTRWALGAADGRGAGAAGHRAGCRWLLWGVFLRVVVGLHCTWMSQLGDRISGAARRLPHAATTRRIRSGWRWSPSARAGTTTTTPIRRRPGTG